jgi:hypothetical protein
MSKNYVKKQRHSQKNNVKKTKPKKTSKNYVELVSSVLRSSARPA